MDKKPSVLDSISVHFPIGIKDFGISAEIDLGEEWFEEEEYEEWQPDFYSESAKIFHYLREATFYNFPNINDYLFPSEKHNWIVYRRLKALENAYSIVENSLKVKIENYDDLLNFIKGIRNAGYYVKNAYTNIVKKVSETLLALNINQEFVILIIERSAPELTKRVKLVDIVRTVKPERKKDYNFDWEIQENDVKEIERRLNLKQYGDYYNLYASNQKYLGIIKKKEGEFYINKKVFKVFKFLVKLNDAILRNFSIYEELEKLKKIENKELVNKYAKKVVKFIEKLILKYYDVEYSAITRYRVYIKKAEVEYLARDKINIKDIRDIVYSINPIIQTLKLEFNKIYAPYEIEDRSYEIIANYLNSRSKKLSKGSLMRYLGLLVPVNVYLSQYPHLALSNSIREGSSYGYMSQFNVEFLDEELLAIDIVKMDKQRSLLVDKQFIANRFYPYSKNEVSIGYNPIDFLTFPVSDIKRVILTYPLVYNLVEKKYYLNITYEVLKDKTIIENPIIKKVLDEMLVKVRTQKLFYTGKNKVWFNAGIGKSTVLVEKILFPSADFVICYLNPDNENQIYYPNKFFAKIVRIEKGEIKEIKIFDNPIVEITSALGNKIAYYLEFDNANEIVENEYVIYRFIDKFDYPLDVDYAISFSFSDKEAVSLRSMLNIIQKAFLDLNLNFEKEKVISLLTNAINHSTSINLFVFFNFKKLWEQVIFLNKRIELEYKERYVIWRWV